jgi:hypothetical protein
MRERVGNSLVLLTYSFGTYNHQIPLRKWILRLRLTQRSSEGPNDLFPYWQKDNEGCGNYKPTNANMRGHLCFRASLPVFLATFGCNLLVF